MCKSQDCLCRNKNRITYKDGYFNNRFLIFNYRHYITVISTHSDKIWSIVISHDKNMVAYGNIYIRSDGSLAVKKAISVTPSSEDSEYLFSMVSEKFSVYDFYQLLVNN